MGPYQSWLGPALLCPRLSPSDPVFSVVQSPAGVRDEAEFKSSLRTVDCILCVRVGIAWPPKEKKKQNVHVPSATGGVVS
ncbi:hypothetical protein HYQ46_009925 [Verticillium longisporum]|nr:hypothetical protein HYQ44_012085 [Verticillium longisporum]KAG7130478.1 hypothetical protein HYQ46_009925 [Verticillium longisporum]